jgi:hypothetical protein
MPDSSTQYTAPKARRVRRLAAPEAFQDEEGNPDCPALAAATGLHRKAVRFILDQDKPPAAPKPKAKDKPSTDPLS